MYIGIIAMNCLDSQMLEHTIRSKLLEHSIIGWGKCRMCRVIEGPANKGDTLICLQSWKWPPIIWISLPPVPLQDPQHTLKMRSSYHLSSLCHCKIQPLK